MILSSLLEGKYRSQSMLRVTEHNQQTPWKHNGVNHIRSVFSIRMTFSGIQIYLIIGFMFAEGKRRVRKALRLRGLSASLDRSYRRSSQVQDTKRRRKAEEGGTRWLIINASRRPPDIIFTLSLSRHTAAGVKNAWAQISESFRKGNAEDSQSLNHVMIQ